MDSRFRFDESATHSRELRVCRTIECGRDAEDQDDFCMKCRDEIDAVRAEARRRFVIWGTSGSLGRGTELEVWRRARLAEVATARLLALIWH
jgi:hypothetical protein